MRNKQYFIKKQKRKLRVDRVKPDARELIPSLMIEPPTMVTPN